MLKRTLSSLFITLLIFTCLPASAKTFKISTMFPDGTAYVVELKKATAEIKAKTEDRVNFKIYPGGVMGDDQAVFRKIRIGQLHGAMMQGGAMAQFYKDSQIYNAPLAFKTFDEVDYVRSKMDQEIIEKLDKAGWVTFGLIDGGFAYIMANEPVKSLEDLRNQKLWLPANDPASENIAKVLDLKPIMLNASEVLTSLQTGAINAIVAPPTAALALQWYSKVQFFSDVPVMYTYALMTIDKKAFSKLSPEDQKITRETLTQLFAKLNKDSRKDNINAIEALKNQEIKPVALDKAEINQWNIYAGEATEKLVANGEFSQSILDELNKYLTEYRSKQ